MITFHKESQVNFIFSVISVYIKIRDFVGRRPLRYPWVALGSQVLIEETFGVSLSLFPEMLKIIIFT